MKLKRAGPLPLRRRLFLSSGRVMTAGASETLATASGTSVAEFSVTTLGVSIEVGSLSRGWLFFRMTLERPKAEIPITTEQAPTESLRILKTGRFSKKTFP